MSLIVGVESEQQTQSEEPTVFKCRPLGRWIQIEPMPPKEMPKTAGGIYIAGGAPRRKKEEAEDHLLFKMTHSKVLAIGPGVTTVKVGQVVKFVGHPENGSPPVQEYVDWQGGYHNLVHEDILYCILDVVPAEPTPPTVLS